MGFPFTTQGPGFCLRVTDLPVLAVGIILGFGLKGLGFPPMIWVLPPYIIFSFFLFCNVFRIRTRFELIWSGTLIFLYVFFIYLGEFWWFPFFIILESLRVVFIFIQIRDGSYKGIFYQKWGTGTFK